MWKNIKNAENIKFIAHYMKQNYHAYFGCDSIQSLKLGRFFHKTK